MTRLYRGAHGALLLLLTLTVLYFLMPRENAAPPPPVDQATESSHARRGASRAEVDSLSMAVRLAAPFQRNRTPAAREAQPATVPAAPTPRPMLALRAIAGGSSPSAAIEGLPGADGPRLLRVGDTAAGIAVRRIRDGTVTLVGYDTTWVLRIGDLR